LTEKYDRTNLGTVEIDHLTVPVRDYETGKRFYADALEPLGFEILLDWHDKRRAYLGIPPAPSSLWVVESHFAGTLEISLNVPDQGSVIAFHNAALAAGGRSLAEPGILDDRSGDYYAARIADFDGNSIEVVYRIAAEARAAA
jgi:catechol 2,3-dioxygenase-like lactoylglutathione lyase family enzyme